MSCALLGEHFDIHGGGLDLQFPHHENEIAQSEGASGKPFVNYWLHNGFLNVDNEKMSKSLGNFFTIRDVLKDYDGETVRFFMLRVHYRSRNRQHHRRCQRGDRSEPNSHARQPSSTPTQAAVMQVASVPDISERLPSSTISARRCGHIAFRPPTMMPRLPRLANPHNA